MIIIMTGNLIAVNLMFCYVSAIAFTYMVIAWGKETNQKDSRKKAADFAQET